MPNIAIIVVSHKPYKMPTDPIYVPVEVGAVNHKEHFFDHRDDQGINISSKNASYCELTGLYWAYKNLPDVDILGLVHYRRYFAKNDLCLAKKTKNYIDEQTANKLLSKYDIILPKKRHYYIETNYSHYVHAHPKEGIDLTRDIIKEYYPEYLSCFDKHMKRRSGHYFNMFIAKKETIIPFLDWMFDILSKIESKLDVSTYSAYDQRVYGFISELLFDVYCMKHNLKIKNQKYFFLEQQNWFKKIYRFLMRKLKSKKQHNN